MYVIGAGGQAGQQALGVRLRPHIARDLVALVDGSSQVDLLRSGNAALLQRHGAVSRLAFGPLVGSYTASANASDGWSAPATQVSTGNLTDFVLMGFQSPGYGGDAEYLCGTYDGSTGCGITARHTGIGYRWGAFDSGSGLASSLANSGEALPNGVQFLVHVRDGSTHKLYRNGVLMSSTAAGNGNAGPTSRWGHGNLGGGLAFSTANASVALSGRFARALTDAEVVALSSNPQQFLWGGPEILPLPGLTSGGSGVSLSGSGSATSAGSAAFTTAAALGGSANAAAAGSAPLSVRALLQGAAGAAGSAQAAISVSCQCQGTGSATTSAYGAISTRAALAGAGSATTGGSAALTSRSALAGQGIAASSATGTLTSGSGGVALAGLSSASSAGSAGLTIGAPVLAGAGRAAVAAGGSLATAAALSGSGAAQGAGLASLGAYLALVGTGRASAAGSAALAQARAALAGDAQAMALAQASLTTSTVLAGIAAASARGAGALAVAEWLTDAPDRFTLTAQARDIEISAAARQLTIAAPGRRLEIVA